MRRASVVPYLPLEELAVWAREAADKGSYQRRLAVWMTATYGFAARYVAELLCVSKQAVWLWIKQYNEAGPLGLSREGRGGRRWAFLSFEEELDLLSRLVKRAERGGILTAGTVKQVVERRLGREVSVGYVYRLLHRHGWRKLTPRPRHEKSNLKVQEEFKKNSPR
jgi:transposase